MTETAEFSTLLSDDVQLELHRRPVKYARVQIESHQKVRVIVPRHYRPGDVEKLLAEKADWMARTVAALRQRAAQALPLAPGELLLHGEPYELKPLASGRRSRVDHGARVVHAALDPDDASALEKWYRSEARRYLPARLAVLAAEHGFRFGKVSIRGQRTRWGSCSSRGNISLNWRLIKAPRFASDYVLLHELLHTRYLHHGSRYWGAMGELCPDYRLAVDWFADNGFLL